MPPRTGRRADRDASRSSAGLLAAGMRSPGGRGRRVEVEFVHEPVVLGTRNETALLGVLERLTQQIVPEVGVVALADRLCGGNDREALMAGHVSSVDVLVVKD